MRFGALLIPNVGWEELRRRALLAEELGFDSVWVDDHAANPARPDQTWIDGWTALAGLALATGGVRLGTMVANVVLRHPVLLARQANSVDELSGGRLELGVGAGYAPTDHALAGTEMWGRAERAERFAEAVGLLDGILRGTTVHAAGRHYGVGDVTVQPAPRQDPRPPLTVAAHAPESIEVAARHGDAWCSFGGWGLSLEELLAVARRRSARLDEACVRAGRPPLAVRRVLLMGSPATLHANPWASAGVFEDMVGRCHEAGIDDVVVYFPPETMYRRGSVPPGVLDEVVADVLPRLRKLEHRR